MYNSYSINIPLGLWETCSTEVLALCYWYSRALFSVWDRLLSGSDIDRCFSGGVLSTAMLKGRERGGSTLHKRLQVSQQCQLLPSQESCVPFLEDRGLKLEL